jgi:hypothetical protein
MFLGGEGWLGIDLASVGAALLYAALWVFVVPIVGRSVVASILHRQDAGGVGYDERDLRIAHASSRFADGSLVLLSLGLVVMLVALPEYSRSGWRPLIAAIVPIALLIARTLVENICTVLRQLSDRG